MAVTAISAITGAGLTAASLASDLTLVGAGLTAFSQFQAGKQQEENAQFNAAVQDQRAEQEKFAVRSEADIRHERGRKLLATQRAKFAGAGVTGAGSPLLVIDETARNIALDVQTTLFSGRQRSNLLRSQASILRTSGKSAFRAGLFGAGTSLLTGATNATSIYKRLQ